MTSALAQVRNFALVTLSATVAVIGVAVAIDSEELTLLTVIVPSSVALLMSWQRSTPVNRLLGARPTPKVAVASAAAFPILGFTAVAVSGVAWSVAGIGFDTIVVIGLIAFGEELGWRGFAYPRLRTRFGPAVAGLAVGALWALWHIPGYVVGVGVAEGASLIAFTFWVLAASLLIAAFMEMGPRSTWYAIVLHAGANLSFAVLPITPDSAGSSAPLLWLASATTILGAGLIGAAGRVRNGPGLTGPGGGGSPVQ